MGCLAQFLFFLAVAEECEIWSWLPLQSAPASEKTSSNPRVNHCLACVYNKTQTDCWSFLKERSRRWSSAEHMQYCKLSVIKLLDNEERLFALQQLSIILSSTWKLIPSFWFSCCLSQQLCYFGYVCILEGIQREEKAFVNKSHGGCRQQDLRGLITFVCDTHGQKNNK